jgi:NADH-quinone oxidoreductase subunit E
MAESVQADTEPQPAGAVVGEATSPAAEPIASFEVKEPSDVVPASEPALVADPLVSFEAPREPDPPPPAPVEPEAPPEEAYEFAAMRAIESGDWSPRRRTRPSRPVQHPEHVGPAEVDVAMDSARSAVASATAAAKAAIAETEEIDRERRAAAAVLEFEPVREVAPHGFLETADTAPAAIETSGLSFEPKAHTGFGRPEGLTAPRDGQADNLKQIKGITPQLESSLNGLGVYHFDQIAGWDQKAVVWIDNHLSLKGRIGKEKWLEQARDLSLGRARTARPVRR